MAGDWPRPFRSLTRLAGEVPGRGAAGVGRAAQEAGQQLEIAVVILGADLVHRRVHARVEAEHLPDPAARRPDQPCRISSARIAAVIAKVMVLEPMSGASATATP